MLWNACILISDSTRFFICILNVGSLQFDEEEYPAGRVYLFNGSCYFPYCCLNRLSLVSLNDIGLGESLGRRKLLSKNDRTEAVKFMIQEFCYTVDEEGQHNKCVPTHATQTPVGNESSNLVLSNSTIPGVIETSEQLPPQSFENDEVFLKNHTKRNNKIETNIEANTTSIIDTSINSEDISLNLANSSFTLSSFSNNESLQQRKDIETKIQDHRDRKIDKATLKKRTATQNDIQVNSIVASKIISVTEEMITPSPLKNDSGLQYGEKIVTGSDHVKEVAFVAINNFTDEAKPIAKSYTHGMITVKNNFKDDPGIVQVAASSLSSRVYKDINTKHMQHHIPVPMKISPFYQREEDAVNDNNLHIDSSIQQLTRVVKSSGIVDVNLKGNKVGVETDIVDKSRPECKHKTYQRSNSDLKYEDIITNGGDYEEDVMFIETLNEKKDDKGKMNDNFSKVMESITDDSKVTEHFQSPGIIKTNEQPCQHNVNDPSLHLIKRSRSKSENDINFNKENTTTLERKESNQCYNQPKSPISVSASTHDQLRDNEHVANESDDDESNMSFNIDESSDSDGSDHKCAICLEHIHEPTMTYVAKPLSCYHQFHRDCMLDWLCTNNNITCPCCRQEWFSNSEILKVSKKLRNLRKNHKRKLRKELCRKYWNVFCKRVFLINK